MSLLLLFNGGGVVDPTIDATAVFNPFNPLTPIGIPSPFERELVQFRANAVQYSESVGGTVVNLIDMGFSYTELNTADVAFITVEGADIRWSASLVVPTAARGHGLYDGSDLILRGRDVIANLQLIAQSGTATVHVSLMRAM